MLNMIYPHKSHLLVFLNNNNPIIMETAQSSQTMLYK